MLRYIGIRNGKVWDITGKTLRNTRKAEDGIDLTPEELAEIVYIQTDIRDIMVGDTWDNEKEINLKDSPQRFIEPEPDPFEILQEKVNQLEARIQELESKE